MNDKIPIAPSAIVIKPNMTVAHPLHDCEKYGHVPNAVGFCLECRKDVPEKTEREMPPVAPAYAARLACPPVKAPILEPHTVNNLQPGANVPIDAVNHPPHYTAHPSGVECIQITEHMGFNLGNAVKYIWRADRKGNREQDLRKAIWYLEREIARNNKNAL